MLETALLLAIIVGLAMVLDLPGTVRKASNQARYDTKEGIASAVVAALAAAVVARNQNEHKKD